MPKRIEQLREKLLSEAKRQIDERGCAETTVRSVAAACGVGVGTVYNYFESKEMLIASVVLEDWKKYLSLMSCLPTNNDRALLHGIFEAISSFCREHERLFSDDDAKRLISAGSALRHKMLREQIAAFVLPVCDRQTVPSPAFTSEFIAEAIICWSTEKKDFDELYAVIEKIIKT